MHFLLFYKSYLKRCSANIYFSLDISLTHALPFTVVSRYSCNSVWCNRAGKDPTYIKKVCLLPSACTYFILLFTICHTIFFILCSDQGCSLTSLYRMSSKTQKNGKNESSSSLTLCCTLLRTGFVIVRICGCVKQWNVRGRVPVYSYERGWDIHIVWWLLSVIGLNLAAVTAYLYE